MHRRIKCFVAMHIISAALVITMILFLGLLACDQSDTLFKVGWMTLYFCDSARETVGMDPTGDCEGKELLVHIWYPAVESAEEKDNPYVSCIGRAAQDAEFHEGLGKLPLIMVSHGGGGGGGSTQSWLSEYLASRGYIVVSPDHNGHIWYNNLSDLGDPDDMPCSFIPFQAWERPRDISFVLTQLLENDTLRKGIGFIPPDPIKRGAEIINIFRDHIDQDRIGAAGFSYGGYTVVALTGLRLTEESWEAGYWSVWGVLEGCISVDQQVPIEVVTASYKDERIKALFAMAPAGSLAPDVTHPDNRRKLLAINTDDLADIQIPVYIVASEADEKVPISLIQETYLAYIEGVQYTMLDAPAGHGVYGCECTEWGEKNVPDNSCFDAEGVDRGAIHETLVDIAERFFKESLSIK